MILMKRDVDFFFFFPFLLLFRSLDSLGRINFIYDTKSREENFSVRLTVTNVIINDTI